MSKFLNLTHADIVCQYDSSSTNPWYQHYIRINGSIDLVPPGLEKERRAEEEEEKAEKRRRLSGKGRGGTGGKRGVGHGGGILEEEEEVTNLTRMRRQATEWQR